MGITDGNHQIKDENRGRVLSAIRRDGPLSRTDISRLTHISKPTVGRIVEGLLAEGLVLETGALPAASKKKPVGLVLNPDAYRCVGINMTRHTLRIILADFQMRVMGSRQRSIRSLSSAAELVATVQDAVAQILALHGVGSSSLLGIGVGAAGIVDHEAGILRNFAFMHRFHDVPLRQGLTERFGVPVFVDNDANTQALGEYWYGYAVGTRDSVFISCREGVGSGIISGGRILRGRSNLTGEIGHTTVNIHGRPCICGRKGCLETYCSAEVIEAETRKFLAEGRDSQLLRQTGGDLSRVDYDAIAQCARSGDTLCLERLGEAADILAEGMRNLFAVLDPEVVTVSGDLFDPGGVFWDLLRQRLCDGLFGANDICLRHRGSGDHFYEISAAALVYRDYFSQ